MRLVGLRQARATLVECIQASQHEQLVITRRGQPVAILIGIRGQTLEDAERRERADFCAMIEESRRAPTVSIDEIRREFNIPGPVPKRPAAKKAARPKATRPKKAARRAQ